MLVQDFLGKVLAQSLAVLEAVDHPRLEVWINDAIHLKQVRVRLGYITRELAYQYDL